MDVDMLLMDDISKLFDLGDERYAVMVADTHDRFERASLMLFNCAHPSNRRLDPEFVEKGSLTTNLHALGWLSEDEIGFIPPEWNHTVGIDPPNPDAKLVHYTMGTPVHQEIKGCEYTEPWMEAVNTAVSSQSWISLMGGSTWAMELSDGRKLPRLHPEARQEADAILDGIGEIRDKAYGFDRPGPGYAEQRDAWRAVLKDLATPQPFTFDAAPEARALLPHLGPLRHLCSTTGAKSLLDHSGGKQGLYEADGLTFPDGSTADSMRAFWGLDAPIAQYDPLREPVENAPNGRFDAVICVDYLHRLPMEDVVWQVERLFALASKFVYVVVSAYPAKQTVPDGGNLHATVKRKTWWELLFRALGAEFPDVRYFVVVNQPVRSKDGKTVIQGTMLQG